MFVVKEFNQLQQQIIKALADYPAHHFYLRSLAQHLVVDPGNLSRDVKILVKQGIATEKKIGNQLHFSLIKQPKTATTNPSLPHQLINQKLSELEPHMVKFTQDLIRIPSVSGENPEQDIAEFILKFAKSYGLRAKMVTKDTFRPNIIIDSDPEKKDTVLLIGHMDTIAIGNISDWRHYPFSGEISDGKIYGRGAADMKGGIASSIFTLIVMKELGLQFPFNVRLVLVSNEEGGSTDTPIFDQGMEFLVKAQYISGKAAIYGYGGSYKIGLGHRGVLRIRIRTHGENVHTGSIKWQTKERGINAVTGMAEILLALEKMKLPEVSHPAFEGHGNVITPGTMILHGGSAVSTVPDECTTVVEVRYLPGVNIKDVYADIKTLAEKVTKKRKGLQVHLEKFVDIPAVAISNLEPVVLALQEACKEVYNKPIITRGTGPANESFMLIRMGIPTVVFGPLAGNAHAVNEYVEIDSLSNTVNVYLRTLDKFTHPLLPVDWT